jgi:hypothetical protein
MYGLPGRDIRGCRRQLGGYELFGDRQDRTNRCTASIGSWKHLVNVNGEYCIALSKAAVGPLQYNRPAARSEDHFLCVRWRIPRLLISDCPCQKRRARPVNLNTCGHR